MNDAFTQPETPTIDLDAPGQPLTVQDMLAHLQPVRTVARVVTRGTLLAERDRLVKELSSMIDAEGNVIVDEDATLGDSQTASAQEKADRVARLDRELTATAWWVTFEGMGAEEWAVFHKQHSPPAPKGGARPDMTEFNIKLIAATAVEPAISEDEARALHKRLGAKQWIELANKAWESCNEGGVSVPKSRSSLLNLARG